MGNSYSDKTQQKLHQFPNPSYNQRAIQELNIVFKENSLKVDNIIPQVNQSQINKLVHQSIGALIVQKHNKGMAIGTGFLISNNLVLTCAHNIYDRQNQSYHNKIKFFINLNGQFGEYCLATHGFVPQQFKDCKENERYKFDYGLLTLEREIQGQQFLPLCKQFRDINSDTQLSIFGYPGKNLRLRQNGNQQTSFHLSQCGLSLRNAIIKTPNDEKYKLMSYKIKAQEGQSGSPVLASINNYTYVVLAIHIGTQPINEQNHILSKGRLITADLIDNLNIWRKKSYGSAFRQFSICPAIFEQQKVRVKSEIIDRSILKQRIDQKWQKIQISSFTNINQRPYLNAGKDFHIMKCMNPLQIPLKRFFKINSYSKKSSLQIGLLASTMNLNNDVLKIIYTSDSSTKTSSILNKNQFAIEDNQLLFIEQGGKLALEIKSKQNLVSFTNIVNNTKFQFTLDEQFIINPLFLFLGMNHSGQIQIIEPLSHTI